jgi:hypothetical protein
MQPLIEPLPVPLCKSGARRLAMDAGLDRKTAWRLKLRDGMHPHAVQLIISRALAKKRSDDAGQTI